MIMVGLDIYVDEYSDAYKPAFKIIKLKNCMTPELSFFVGPTWLSSTRDKFVPGDQLCFSALFISHCRRLKINHNFMQ